MLLGAVIPEEEVLARAPASDFLTGSRPASCGGSTAPCLFLSISSASLPLPDRLPFPLLRRPPLLVTESSETSDGNKSSELWRSC